MFTGIVESIGTVLASAPAPGGCRLRIQAETIARDVTLGASVSVSGVCLTVANREQNVIEFDVVHETLRKTSLGQRRSGDLVNLERSLRLGDRLDGHLVQGHVDGTAVVTNVIAAATDYVLWFQPQAPLLPLIIPKGSVTVEGVSLTVADLDSDRFSVALIPTTLERTNLRAFRIGSVVNIETDMIVRTIHHLLNRGGTKQDITHELLREAGFLS
ncbi:MAG: riboflavin synthase [Planctomycetota bacterium]